VLAVCLRVVLTLDASGRWTTHCVSHQVKPFAVISHVAATVSTSPSLSLCVSVHESPVCSCIYTPSSARGAYENRRRRRRLWRSSTVGRFACLGAGWKSIAAAAAASPVGRGCFRLVSHVSACAADGALSPSTPTVRCPALVGRQWLGAALAWPRLSRPALYRLPLDD